jgi:hypothetical protein
VPDYYSVKEAIFPFAKFQGVDPILGPEMRSTGEVMGVGRSFGAAFARAQEAAGIKAPQPGKAFISVRDPDKARVLPVARYMLERGFSLVATQRHRRVAARARHRMRAGQQGDRGPAAYRRPDQERRDRATSSTPPRAAGDRRLVLDPARGPAAARHLFHHRVRREAHGAFAGIPRHGPVLALQELHKELRVSSTHHREGRAAPARRAGRTEVGQAAGSDRRDRRGARARRPQGKRRVPRRPRAAGLHRRPHQAAGGENCRTRRSSTSPSSTPAQGRVRRHGDLADVDTDEQKRYQIVGDLEADIKQGLIAISSPVARAMIGKHEGDAITIEAPAGSREYEIISVKYLG